MELWLSTAVQGGDDVELAVEVDPTHSVRQLTAAIADHLGDPSGRTLLVDRLGTALDPDSTLADSDLRFGDRVSLLPDGSPSPRSKRTVGTPAHLDVVGGPSAGTRRELRDGEHLIGRAPPAEIVIDDPTMSRSHLTITIDDGHILVEDAGSSNGTFIEGAPVLHRTPIGPGAMIDAGHSLLRIGTDTSAASSFPTHQGRLRFNRPPRVMRPLQRATFAIPTIPTPPERTRLPMLSAMAPMLIAIPLIVVSLTTGSTSMAVLGIGSAVLAPVLALASWIEDRRNGRGRFRRQSEAFRRDLDALSSELANAMAHEVNARRKAAPDAPTLIDRALNVRPELWERRPTDADFCDVSVGWADRPTQNEIAVPTGGDEELRAEACGRIRPFETVHNVPVTVSFRSCGNVGLAGDPAAVDGLTRWMLIQLATLHSPRDVIIACASAVEQHADWSWLAWLPHTRSSTSPIDGPHLASGTEQAAALLEAIGHVVSGRVESSERSNSDAPPPGPSLILVMSALLPVPRALVTPILESGPAVGVHVLWLGADPAKVPGECGALIETTARPSACDVTLPALGEIIREIVLDQLDTAVAREVARALAPLVDVTAGGKRTQIPTKVDLLDLLQLDRTDGDTIAEQWRSAEDEIDGIVGVSGGGPWRLDLRRDGPHALVGGTTGAGKSELLQSFVAAMAATHPPSRVTFLLVDYKGGAAFKDAVNLPHTVGLVTDLDGHLVHRALVSLNAELHRRERLLRDHGAKDLLEMERRFPADAPPALVLIVDEFATLAKELPDFVDGVVNVAQRGRSLGIHMILATQRPAGAINDNIRANTNLRIALRMNDVADSQDVIDAADAAMLPRTLPGRAFARTGQGELTELQVAYVGGNSTAAPRESDRPILIADLNGGCVTWPTNRRPVDHHAATDLQVLVQATRDAATLLDLEPPRAPWLPPLPPILPLETVADGFTRTGCALLGIADVPEHQRQEPRWFDLERDGNLLVYGGSGSGKTTFLRSFATSLACGHAADELHLYALDFATRGLMALAPFPHVGDVIAGDDVERVQRLIRMLEDEMGSRRDRFAATGSSALSEYRRVRPDQDIARIVLLLDGYAGFQATFDRIDFGDWITRLSAVVAEGRPLGIHVVMTADRRSAVGLSLSSLVTTRVVLRMADDDDYGSLGLDPTATRGAVLVPGRGFVDTGTELQVPLVGDDPQGDAQVAAIARLAATLPAVASGGPAPVGAMPTEVDGERLPVAHRLAATIGIAQADLAPISIDLDNGNVFVTGPNRSGKSTALATITHGLRASTPDAEFFLLAPRRSPLTSLSLWSRTAARLADCDELVDELNGLLDTRNGDETPLIVVIDDATELTDGLADQMLERIARRGPEVGIHVVASGDSTLARRAYGGIVSEVRRDRHGLLLRPDEDLDGDLLNTSIPRTRAGFWTDGRGLLVADNRSTIVQVGMYPET